MKVLDIVKDIIITEDLEILKKYESQSLEEWDALESSIKSKSKKLNTIEDFIEYSPIFNKYKYKDAVKRVNIVIERINIQHFFMD